MKNWKARETLSKHAPARFINYKNAHDNYMQNLRASGFTDVDSLRFFEAGDKIKLEGEISCLGGIVIGVLKTLDVLEGQGKDTWVQTSTYSYNATVQHRGNILRVGNTHPVEGFPDDHHINLYDWKTNTQLPNSPKWIGEDDWPTLGEFVEEIRDWYNKNREELPTPNEYGQLGLRD